MSRVTWRDRQCEDTRTLRPAAVPTERRCNDCPRTFVAPSPYVRTCPTCRYRRTRHNRLLQFAWALALLTATLLAENAIGAESAAKSAEDILRNEITYMQDAATSKTLTVEICTDDADRRADVPRSCRILRETQARIALFVAIEAARGTLDELRRAPAAKPGTVKRMF